MHIENMALRSLRCLVLVQTAVFLQGAIAPYFNGGICLITPPVASAKAPEGGCGGTPPVASSKALEGYVGSGPFSGLTGFPDVRESDPQDSLERNEYSAEHYFGLEAFGAGSSFISLHIYIYIYIYI